MFGVENGDQKSVKLEKYKIKKKIHCIEIPTFFINVFIFACKQILGFMWRECFFFGWEFIRPLNSLIPRRQEYIKYRK